MSSLSSSGYVITSMLLRKQSQTRRINPLRFWGQRARRLLPAVFVLVAVVALWTAHHNAIITFPARRADMLSNVFYFANWHFIAV
jgi:peptidoglycan/LPS O-acetylase OafA/YrhL